MLIHSTLMLVVPLCRHSSKLELKLNIFWPYSNWKEIHTHSHMFQSRQTHRQRSFIISLIVLNILCCVHQSLWKLFAESANVFHMTEKSNEADPSKTYTNVLALCPCQTKIQPLRSAQFLQLIPKECYHA